MQETLTRIRFSGDALSRMLLTSMVPIPYLALAGLYAVLAEGRERDFWLTAEVLIGGRILYAVLDSLMSIAVWRWYARGRTTHRMLALFTRNHMPQREHVDETLAAYLRRVETGDDEYPVGVQCTARQFSTLIEQAKRDGLLCGRHMEEAITSAYNRYTRRSSLQAPRRIGHAY